MQRNLSALADRTYDVLVIGGGIYGLCVAWDAALRGLTVALLDKGDFGQATSANSLRVIHGGLRYLQHGDLRRMRQSIRERRHFLRMAPHLVQPLPCFIPAYGHTTRGVEALAGALFVHNVVGYDRNHRQAPSQWIPRGRILSKQECLRLFPGLSSHGLTGGGLCYDAQVSRSERLMLAIAQAAVTAGAELANYMDVTRLCMRRGRVTGVQARDALQAFGPIVDIRAHTVVNTSGPWLQHVLRFAPVWTAPRPLRFSKAFNVLINRQLSPDYAVGVYGTRHFRDGAAMVRKGARLFFIVPWQGRSLVGTAHLPYEAPPDAIDVTEGEIQGFLDDVNAAYPGAGLQRHEVEWVYRGLLPSDGNDMGDVQLTKSHLFQVHRGLDGLVSVLGVKLTEARYVAEQTVHWVLAKLGRQVVPSRTVTALVHGAPCEPDTVVRPTTEFSTDGLSSSALQGLIDRYGTAYRDVLIMLDDAAIPGQTPDHDGRGATYAPFGLSLLLAQVLYGVRHEMACTLADVVFRRTSMALDGHIDDVSLRHCAALMAGELGWDPNRMQREVEEVQSQYDRGTNFSDRRDRIYR